MEFKLNEILKSNDYFINIGKINNKLAIILSKFSIDNFEIILESSKINSKKGNCWNMSNNKENFELYYPCDTDCFDENVSKYIIINETKNEYIKKIKPYIDKIYHENTKWIYDIFEGKAEKENVIYKNDNFLICRDIGWTDINYNNFYILGFPIKVIKNIRDLRSDDVVILKEMKKEMLKYAKKFKLGEENLYFFFHYHPSTYHLHLHCSIINNKNLSSKYKRHHMFEDVIENLEKDTFYYYNKNISFEIPDYHIIAKLSKL